MKKNKNDIISIRESRIDDIPLILDFIKELAEYEKLSHEVYCYRRDFA